MRNITSRMLQATAGNRAWRHAATMLAGIAMLGTVAAFGSGQDHRPQRALTANSTGSWWAPGDGRPFPARLDYANGTGVGTTLSSHAPVDTQRHPFFTPQGPDGRACITCHQPADAMSLAAHTARERWDATQGHDPLFAAYDGSNCPNLRQRDPAAHSLLLEHGLIRVARAWPPRDDAGRTITPDFTLEVLRDPTGCNSSPGYGPGVNGDGQVSVYRRPRPVANLKYLLAIGFAYDPKQGMPLALDPETHVPVSGNLMADGRAPTLRAQARDAAQTHLRMTRGLNERELAQIVEFETGLHTAQGLSFIGGPLDIAEAEAGPKALAEQAAGVLGSQNKPVWSEFAAWENPAPEGTSAEVAAFRASVARGARIFRERTFLITDSAGINSPMGFGNPVRNSCVFCHNMAHMGNDVAPGQVDLGTVNLPHADPAPHLPLFRVTCTGEPHPHYGRTIFTNDPGFALTTGRCADVGKITLQSMRGLAARAPYFSNGSAKDLRAVVDYYDRRYRIGYTAQEKQDLVNLMSSL